MFIRVLSTNKKIFIRLVGIFVLFSFFSTSLGSSAYSAGALPYMPEPSRIVLASSAYIPVQLSGIRFYPDNPLKFDFIIHEGTQDSSDAYNQNYVREESAKLIRYFLAALTIPEDELWVNLSPFEDTRIATDALAKTELGQDLLGEDYILKQLAASITHPDSTMGKQFWQKTYEEARKRFGAETIPLNTFNKIWIVPHKTQIYEDGNRAIIGKSSLKVMMEEDYAAMQKNVTPGKPVLPGSQFNTSLTGKPAKPSNGLTQVTSQNNITTQIMKEVILPAIEKDVNSGKNFAQLRQLYSAVILAAWFKRALRASLSNDEKKQRTSVLFGGYINQKKTKGIDTAISGIKEKVYNQYLEAYKKGVYDLIKKEYQPHSKKNVRKRYFSGGTDLITLFSSNSPVISTSPIYRFNPKTHMGFGANQSLRVELDVVDNKGNVVAAEKQGNGQQATGIVKEGVVENQKTGLTGKRINRQGMPEASEEYSFAYAASPVKTFLAPEEADAGIARITLKNTLEEETVSMIKECLTDAGGARFSDYIEKIGRSEGCSASVARALLVSAFIFGSYPSFYFLPEDASGDAFRSQISGRFEPGALKTSVYWGRWRDENDSPTADIRCRIKIKLDSTAMHIEAATRDFSVAFGPERALCARGSLRIAIAEPKAKRIVRKIPKLVEYTRFYYDKTNTTALIERHKVFVEKARYLGILERADIWLDNREMEDGNFDEVQWQAYKNYSLSTTFVLQNSMPLPEVDPACSNAFKALYRAYVYDTGLSYEYFSKLKKWTVLSRLHAVLSSESGKKSYIAPAYLIPTASIEPTGKRKLPETLTGDNPNRFSITSGSRRRSLSSPITKFLSPSDAKRGIERIVPLGNFKKETLGLLETFLTTDGANLDDYIEMVKKKEEYVVNNAQARALLVGAFILGAYPQLSFTGEEYSFAKFSEELDRPFNGQSKKVGWFWGPWQSNDNRADSDIRCQVKIKAEGDTLSLELKTRDFSPAHNKRAHEKFQNQGVLHIAIHSNDVKQKGARPRKLGDSLFFRYSEDFTRRLVERHDAFKQVVEVLGFVIDITADIDGTSVDGLSDYTTFQTEKNYNFNVNFQLDAETLKDESGDPDFIKGFKALYNKYVFNLDWNKVAKMSISRSQALLRVKGLLTVSSDLDSAFSVSKSSSSVDAARSSAKALKKFLNSTPNIGWRYSLDSAASAFNKIVVSKARNRLAQIMWERGIKHGSKKHITLANIFAYTLGYQGISAYTLLNAQRVYDEQFSASPLNKVVPRILSDFRMLEGGEQARALEGVLALAMGYGILKNENDYEYSNMYPKQMDIYNPLVLKWLMHDRGLVGRADIEELFFETQPSSLMHMLDNKGEAFFSESYVRYKYEKSCDKDLSVFKNNFSSVSIITQLENILLSHGAVMHPVSNQKAFLYQLMFAVEKGMLVSESVPRVLELLKRMYLEAKLDTSGKDDDIAMNPRESKDAAHKNVNNLLSWVLENMKHPVRETRTAIPMAYAVLRRSGLIDENTFEKEFNEWLAKDTVMSFGIVAFAIEHGGLKNKKYINAVMDKLFEHYRKLSDFAKDERHAMGPFHTMAGFVRFMIAYMQIELYQITNEDTSEKVKGIVSGFNRYLISQWGGRDTFTSNSFISAASNLNNNLYLAVANGKADAERLFENVVTMCGAAASPLNADDTTKPLNNQALPNGGIDLKEKNLHLEVIRGVNNSSSAVKNATSSNSVSILQPTSLNKVFQNFGGFKVRIVSMHKVRDIKTGLGVFLEDERV